MAVAAARVVLAMAVVLTLSASVAHAKGDGERLIGWMGETYNSRNKEGGVGRRRARP